jgi:eukaryotic-like serine/threonine-protein kinase
MYSLDMVARMSTARSGDVFGPYRLEEALGEGRMGVVFRATDVRDDRAVALKLLRPELAEDRAYVRRFVREGDIALQLRHPHVVSVLERGESGGALYLAAEFVPGRQLAEVVVERPLDEAEAARIAAQIASALDAVHAHGLVHRDVKPANVIVTPSGTALLTDFGVARGEADTTLTKAGHVVGTVDYLAPEVIRGEPATPSSDIYSLGCLAYECVSGKPPFADRTVVDACLAHLRDDPPPLDTVAPPFAESLLRALAKDPAARPPTATGYARLLRAAARDR